MKIVIASYDRVDLLLNKTLHLLEVYGIAKSQIYVFVANELQYQIYLEKLPEGINIIIGELGMNAIRNFITDYLEDGEIYLSMDDDIDKFRITENKTFLQVLDECENLLQNSQYHLIGFPPTFNNFFNRSVGMKFGLYFCVGAMWICKNDKSIRVENSLEDYERTIKSYIKYGCVIRCCDIQFRTKYYGNGGMNSAEGRTYEKYYNALIKLYYEYPDLIRVKKKNIPYLSLEPCPHILLKKHIANTKVLQLPELSPIIFIKLLDMLTQKKLSKQPDMLKKYQQKMNGEIKGLPSKRRFPEHRAEVFGYIKRRPFLVRPNAKEISKISHKNPDLYNELLRIGNIICPFKFSSIFINNNCISPKHKDSGNIGLSLLVSFGDYQGCNIVVEDEVYDAKYKPLIFDGSKLEHWNTPFIGEQEQNNKYSLIFYNILD